MKKIFITSIIILISLSGFSQSTKGKEFWIGFMENIALSMNGPPVFRLHVNSDVTTTCSVTIPYTTLTLTFVVNANQVYIFTLPPGNFNPLGDEAIANNGIWLTSNDTVEVKAFHHRINFTESTIVLPIQEIGTEYLVMAQKDALGNSPSEFVVLATQNNTTVEIIPTAITVGSRPANVPFTVVLQRGQMYQLQAFDDLSGSSVKSLDPLKKIAVFGGARQAQFGCTGGADDHIYDQAYPVSSFGTGYHVIPFKGHYFDLVKIIASQNSTTVSVTGGNTFSLAKGQVVSFTVNASCEITSNLPIAVSQLATSAACNGNNGDPGMINLVPFNLYQTKANFYTTSSLRLGAPADYFPDHSINIVIKTGAVGNLKLDNNVVPSNLFTSVAPNSIYSYARLTLDTLSSLNHILTCDIGFNATIYSFPYYNFYGHHLGYNRPNSFSPTGFNKNETGTSLRIFPVPANDILHIRAARLIKSIKIIDVFGKEVLVISHLKSEQIDITLNSLTEGIYNAIIEYNDLQGNIEVMKFVKARNE